MNTIPVRKTIAYAYSFTFGHLPTMLGLGWLPVLLFSACVYFTINTYLGGLIGFMREENPAELGPVLVLFLLGMAVAMALCAVLAVVLTRQALGLRTGGARVYLAFGHTEWRTLGALVRLSLLILLLLFALGMLSGIVGGIVGLATRTADQPLVAGEVISPAVTLVLTLLMIAGLLAIFYVFIRVVFLMVAVIVAVDDPQPLRTSWTLGRGNFWRMFLVQLAVAGPLILLQELVEWLIEGPVPVVGGAPGSVANTVGELLLLQSQLPLSTLVSGIVYLFIFPLIYSAEAFAYRALVPVNYAPARPAVSGFTPPP